jgi:hypothetical protein
MWKMVKCGLRRGGFGGAYVRQRVIHGVVDSIEGEEPELFMGERDRA